MHKANFIWLPASEEPTNIDVPVLVWTENNKLMTFANTQMRDPWNRNQFISQWTRLVCKYHIKYWVYQVDVMNI